MSNEALCPLSIIHKKVLGWTVKFFKQWFYYDFVPLVKKYLKYNGLPMKAVLLIDNAPSHPSVDQLLVKDNISVKFLPPNVTALVQPMDQGVLEKMKKVYKRQMLSKLVEDEGELGVMGVLKSFNVKTVLYMIAEAWNEVERDNLVKSWKKLWPGVCSLPENKFEEEIDQSKEKNKEDEFIKIFKKIDGCSEVDEEDIDNWLLMDSDGGYKSITDEEIIASCGVSNNENAEDSDVDEPDVSEPDTITHSEAVNLVDKLMTYFEKQEEKSPNELLLLKRLRDRFA
uniref:DDE-1 domain-containing protein n=2 Tax=Graphocephala atropunctata TaxID=36148 RepID=A0A1B6LQW8_9HEMI